MKKRAMLAVFCGIIVMVGLVFLLSYIPYIGKGIVYLDMRLSEVTGEKAEFYSQLGRIVGISFCFIFGIASLISGVVIGWIMRRKSKLCAGITTFSIGFVVFGSYFFLVLPINRAWILHGEWKSFYSWVNVSAFITWLLIIPLMGILGGFIGEKLAKRRGITN